MTSPRIAAVVLAGGLSSRMPANKLLASLGSKPVIRYVVEAALASWACPVIVVTGHARESIASALDGLDIRIVENKDFAAGLSESLKCGVRSIPPDCAGAAILLGDMPFVTPALLNGLIDAFEAGHEISVPVRNGRRGNPVLWGRRFFPDILTLTGDKGAKPLMDLYRDALFELEVDDDGPLIDIDTPNDLQHHQP